MFKRKTTSKRPPVSTLQHLFHGIEIEPGEDACTAARALAGTRFLSDEAPRLPLEHCTCASNCRCVYRHFSDRRTETRRECDEGLPPRGVSNDQRDGLGRRVTDG